MEIIVKTQAGLEPLLAGELRDLGLDEVKEGRRMVSCSGELEQVWEINYKSRLALKVLVPIAAFEIKEAQDLYKSGMEIPWQDWIRKGQTFSIKFTVNSPHFKNSLYGAQLLKDTVVDVLREKYGERPSVDRKRPDIVIDLHIYNDKCTVSMDSSGEPLFKRNYKNKAFKAPINEILAAGMIMLTGWDGSTDFLNPMCGSGTLLWEALFIAERRPPQFYRKHFAFKAWQNFNANKYYEMKEAADLEIRTPRGRILGVDNHAVTMKMLRKNLRELELNDYIHTSMIDFFDYTINPGDATIVINPPYDERLKLHDVSSFYKAIGDHLKTNFQGNTAWIITSNPEAIKSIGLKPTEKYTLYNGPLECKYLKFDLFSGSRKDQFTE